MKSIYVEDLSKGMTITNETFAIQDAEKNDTKDGKPYYRVTFVDKTGSVNGQIWADKFPNIELAALKAGNLVMLDGSVEEFKGKTQINVLKLTRVDETALEEYIESSDFDLDELWKMMMGFVQKVENKQIAQLLVAIFADKEMAAKYKVMPAAEQVHHSFRGGLLEHVVEMLTLADAFRTFYKDVNYDLVIAGIVLHDIGKIFELKNEGMVVQRTNEGALVGHLVKSFEILLKYGADILDEEAMLNLKHIILAHHGEMEYGSPVVPSTIEAAMVNCVDVASSKVRIFQKAIKRSSKRQGDFSDFDTILRTKVYKKPLSHDEGKPAGQFKLE